MHPGELATKVRYFGVKSTNVIWDQMGTLKGWLRLLDRQLGEHLLLSV